MKIRKTLVATALLALLAVAAVIVAGIVVPGGAPQAQAADPVVLTVTGNGQSKTFTMAELKALPVYSGYFGLVNSAGTVYPPLAGQRSQGQRCARPDRRHDDAERLRRPGVRQLRHDLHLRPGGQQQRRPALQRDDQGEGGPQGAVDLRRGLRSRTASLFRPRRPTATGPLRLVVAQESNENQVVDGHYWSRWWTAITLRGAVEGLEGQDVRPQAQGRHAPDLHPRPRVLRLLRRPRLPRVLVDQPDDQQDVERRAALLLHRQGRRRQGPRQRRRLQRGARPQGLPHQAGVGDRQVRDHRLAHGAQPHEHRPRQQAHGLRSDGQVLPAATRRADEVRARRTSRSAGSARSSCCPSETSGLPRERARNPGRRRRGAGRPAGACGDAGSGRPGLARRPAPPARSS